MTDCFDGDGIVELAKRFPGKNASAFLDWFLYSDNTVDGKSRQKAYELFGSGLLDSLEPGSVKCLQQIHGYIFGERRIRLGPGASDVADEDCRRGLLTLRTSASSRHTAAREFDIISLVLRRVV